MKLALQRILCFQGPTATYEPTVYEPSTERHSMYIDPEYRPSTLPAEIVLFCDADASLFKAIVKHHSLEVDGMIAEELGYLNLHHRRRTDCGLIVNYLQFDFFSHSEGRFYRITRFDTLEDAARFLLSEPYHQRGAVLVSGSESSSGNTDNSVTGAENLAKALIRTTLGFSCVAILFNGISKLHQQGTDYGERTDKLMDFAENGIVEKGSVTRIEGSTRAMLNAKRGSRPKQNAWWCPSPVEQLQSLMSYFHLRLPQHDAVDEIYLTSAPTRTRNLSKVLTARFYCYDEKEGGSPITAMDNLKISIAGNMVVEGHIVDAPGLAIEPGKLCQSNVLILLEKAVAADSRDQFVVRRMDGASVGVGMIVSCS